MATKAERFRSEEQRTHAHAGSTAKKRPKKARWRTDRARAGKKATYSLEEHARGARASRKSTRSSANRLKADAPRNITEEVRATAPRAVALRAGAKRAKVRGKRRSG